MDHYPNDCDCHEQINKAQAWKNPSRAQVLQEAERLITGDRNVTYGSPIENFTNIGEMWTTRLRHKLKDGEEILPSDVADLMVLVKIARNIANPKRDNYVDGAGYFACGYECLEEEENAD